ncbi:MAG TPA: nucleotide exchange factor GrpE [Candidatus Eremiobacteraeota bacterium]|nr:MAG: Protein GrpE [bacterium ADurb.Bin363]HPZ08109.1 nucleotide exchange factor GrpE [Candidatus Eremiobacteraeota bacterium]
MKFFVDLLDKIFHRTEFLELKSEVLDLRRKLRELEIKLEEKESLVEKLKKEYEQLKNTSKEEATIAKKEEITDIVTELAIHMAQLNTMKKLQEDGKEVRIKDILRLFKQIEKIFERKGLIQIGEAGKKVSYDSTLHQPSDNISLCEKQEVIVRFCGYMVNDKLIKRAIVSIEE